MTDICVRERREKPEREGEGDRKTDCVECGGGGCTRTSRLRVILFLNININHKIISRRFSSMKQCSEIKQGRDG